MAALSQLIKSDTFTRLKAAFPTKHSRLVEPGRQAGDGSGVQEADGHQEALTPQSVGTVAQCCGVVMYSNRVGTVLVDLRI